MSSVVELPQSLRENYDNFTIDTPGMWGILSDTHIPWHDCAVLSLFAKEGKKRNIKGILLNGDLIDSHEISSHDRDPAALRYIDEVDRAKQFLAWLRYQFPKVRIVYKAGNHEERFERYVMRHAPALFGLEGLNIPSLLHLKDHGIEWVSDKRIVNMGKLSVIHGHEYRGSGGVNPARWLYLRTGAVTICSHFHRTSEHHSRNILGKSEAAWSIGCACSLFPKWLRLNEWNFGFAWVDLENDGNFVVENKRVLNGKIV